MTVSALQKVEGEPYLATGKTKNVEPPRMRVEVFSVCRCSAGGIEKREDRDLVEFSGGEEGAHHQPGKQSKATRAVAPVGFESEVGCHDKNPLKHAG